MRSRSRIGDQDGKCSDLDLNGVDFKDRYRKCRIAACDSIENPLLEATENARRDSETHERGFNSGRTNHRITRE